MFRDRLKQIDESRPFGGHGAPEDTPTEMGGGQIGLGSRTHPYAQFGGRRRKGLTKVYGKPDPTVKNDRTTNDNVDGQRLRDRMCGAAHCPSAFAEHSCTLDLGVGPQVRRGYFFGPAPQLRGPPALLTAFAEKLALILSLCGSAKQDKPPTGGFFVSAGCCPTKKAKVRAPSPLNLRLPEAQAELEPPASRLASLFS